MVRHFFAVSCFWKPISTGRLNPLFRVSPMFRIPDNCKVKAKMIYAASKDAIRKSLQGIATEVQATDASEISYETGARFLRSLLHPSLNRPRSLPCSVLDRVSRGTA